MTAPREPLDRSTLSQQTAALASHLHRSGISWIPQPRAAQVQQWQAWISEAASPTEASSTVEPSSAAAPVSPEPIPGKPRAANSQEAAAPETASERRDAPASIRPQFRGESVAAVESTEGPYPGVSLPLADREAALGQLRDQVAHCVRCEALVACRTQTVFGEGNAEPRFVFFGEGPGQEEDRTGRPFVGRAGQLLTRMIEACKLQREETYILNTIKCRPPGNRNPEPDEREHCREYYEQQLQLLRPEYIVCLGAVSAQELLKSKLSVGRLRGKLHRYFDSKVLVTYHPAYLLRNPSAKRAAWQDLQLMLRDAGLM